MRIDSGRRHTHAVFCGQLRTIDIAEADKKFPHQEADGARPRGDARVLLRGEHSGASAAARTTRTVVTTEKIPYSVAYQDEPARYRGYTEVVSAGIAGEREIRSQVVFEGDRPVKVLSVQSTDTARPVDQVVKRGTRVLRSETADGSRWVSSFIRPLKTGWLSADFYDYPHHNGIDLAAPHGTPVYAAAQGRVVLAGWYGEYGKCVIIEHADGSRTLYGHNSSLDVSVGQEVKQGEKIANVGSTGNSTGNHLHFEIRIGSSFLDPLVYIDK